MKLYADTAVRRTTQVVGDVLLLLWLVAWVWIGVQVHDGTMALAGPGRQTQSSATDLADSLAGAGDSLRGLPVVGDAAAQPLDGASSASRSIAGAAGDEVEAVGRLALWLGLSIAAIPILVVMAFYVPVRWRFVRRATAGARFVDAAADLDLFALRALARQPLHVLARVSDDPAGAWRDRDPDVVLALGRLELREAGLRVPSRLSQVDS